MRLDEDSEEAPGLSPEHPKVEGWGEEEELSRIMGM